MNRLLVLLVVLSGCAAVEPAVFKNPKTGEVKECTSSASGGLVHPWTAQHEIDICAAEYQRMGWVKQ